MLRNRSVVFKDFKSFEQEKDKRSMDEICNGNSPSDFMLQAQQKFLVQYMKTNPEWRSLLLYHAIGSGKTCSSISMAEEYMRTDPKRRIIVILPARLRSNFFDELISPCGMNTYITAEEFTRYHDSSTSNKDRKHIRTTFMKAIGAKYEIMSFEKMRGMVKTFPSLKEWARHLSEDRMLIFDEVHNLLNEKFKPEVLDIASRTHEIPSKTQGVLTLLFKYLTKHAHPTCKMVMMTATPVFDNILQLKSLLYSVYPEYTGPSTTLLDVINGFRGKVSFFPGTSLNAYPTSSFVTHNIPFSNTQDLLTSKLTSGDEDEEPKTEAFMIKQRQISLSCFPQNDNIQTNLNEYAPKIVKLIQQIKLPGKHLVYSNFITKGLHIIRDALVRLGWVDYLEDDSGPNNKTFVIWDGSILDLDKERVKSTFNSKENISGKQIRVILGSPSIKEGISFKHIQHLHMMDPVWNQSSKTQIEGRAIRFCSHVDIPSQSSKALKRSVVIHTYKSIPKTIEPKIEMTCDMIIYDKIIPAKYERVSQAEEALKRVSLDYHLFKKIYRQEPVSRPPTPSAANSPLNIELPGTIKATRKVKPKNTCPKPRRPPCSPGEENRPNLLGHPCCYKNKARKVIDPTTLQPVASTKNTCPKPRRPDDNGNCPTNQEKRLNIHGHECCYKR